MAPAIAALYHEPRLIGVTASLATAFIFNAAGVQHGAILQRQMRFTNSVAHKYDCSGSEHRCRHCRRYA